jgi:uncharacterized protein
MKPLILTVPISPGEDDCACASQAARLVLSQADDPLFEQDCACAGRAAWPGLHLSQADAGRAYQQTGGVFTAALPGGYTLAFSPLAPGGPAALNPAAWQRWQAFARPQPAGQPGDADLLAHALIHPQGRPAALAFDQRETLTAWLHLTTACNLGCPYCYAPRSPATMPLETGRRALEGLFAEAAGGGYQRVKLKFAGGEPTLCFELVQALHAHARRLSAESGLALVAVLLSNGTRLGPPQAAWLAANGVRLMVSLDGVGAAHDAQRPQRQGGGSFEQVAAAIDGLLLPAGVRPAISMTLTRLNVHAAPELARWAVVERGLPLSFNFYRRPPGQAADLSAAPDELIAALRQAYRVIEARLPAEPLLGGLLDRVQLVAHARPCGAGDGYRVITPDGSPAPCHMLIGRAGRVDNPAVDEKAACGECAFRYRCAGGCPIEAQHLAGHSAAPGPHCAVYRALLPDLLRLEGLRILKAHGVTQ